jgi:hypothetical protein
VKTISRTIIEIQRQGVIKHEAHSSDLANDAEARRRYLGV